MFYSVWMFIRRLGRKNGSTLLKIIENVRVGCSNAEPVAVKYAVDLIDASGEKRINVGIEDVFGAIYSQMDFEDVIAGTNARRKRKVELSRQVVSP